MPGRPSRGRSPFREGGVRSYRGSRRKLRRVRLRQNTPARSLFVFLVLLATLLGLLILFVRVLRAL